MEIYVNGKKRDVIDAVVWYSDVVLLAEMDGNLTVSYSRGVNAEYGTMSPGDCVMVSPGMVFTVAYKTEC